MNKRIKKLNNRRGVSILLALLILLMCAFAGAGAITMAATNMGRYSHSAEDQQAYYSVTAAARMIRDQLDGITYTSKGVEYTHLVEVKYENNDHTSTDSYSLKFSDAEATLKSVADIQYEKDLEAKRAELEAAGDKKTDPTTLVPKPDPLPILTTGIKSALIRHLDMIIPYRSIPLEWYTMVENFSGTEISDVQRPAEELKPETHTFTVTSDNISIGTVQGTLILGDNFDLTFSFTYQAGSGDKIYSVSLYMEASADNVTDTVVKSDPPSGKQGSSYETTTRKVQVTWTAANSTISRGEAIVPEGVTI